MELLQKKCKKISYFREKLWTNYPNHTPCLSLYHLEDFFDMKKLKRLFTRGASRLSIASLPALFLRRLSIAELAFMPFGEKPLSVRLSLFGHAAASKVQCVLDTLPRNRQSRFLSILTVLLCAASLSLPQCKNDNGGGNGDNSSPGPGSCPTEGDGTADCPLLISSRSQLEKISMGLDKHYELGQNIDLQDDPFTPISGSFTGSLDGKGYEIQNLTIVATTKQAGLFAELGADGSIQNLGIVGLNVTSANTGGTDAAPVRIGALAAQMSGGEIKNCYAIANDSDADPDLYGGSGDYDSVGGLVGWSDHSSIIGSYANGNADGGAGDDDYVGGLVGAQTGGSIVGSYATGDSDGGAGDDDEVGGLVGRSDHSSIIGSYATGDADGGAEGLDYVGGLVGRQNNGSIIASYANGDADGEMGTMIL